MGTKIEDEATEESTPEELEQMEQQIRGALAAAEAQGGEVAAAARRHLGPAIAAMDKAKTEMEAARAAEEASRERVRIEAEKADQVIARIHDEMERAGRN